MPVKRCLPFRRTSLALPWPMKPTKADSTHFGKGCRMRVPGLRTLVRLAFAACVFGGVALGADDRLFEEPIIIQVSDKVKPDVPKAEPAKSEEKKADPKPTFWEK